ncbi:Phosphorylase b kinase regulatory subunit beta, partial [Araneus ventricosus]
MILDGIFKGNDEQIKKYRHLLHPRLKVDRNGNAVVPKYFYVPTLCIDAERREPGSQKRIPSEEGDADNLFLMGQALYIMSELLVDGLLHINELDPIRRYLPSYNRP